MVCAWVCQEFTAGPAGAKPGEKNTPNKKKTRSLGAIDPQGAMAYTPLCGRRPQGSEPGTRHPGLGVLARNVPCVGGGVFFCFSSGGGIVVSSFGFCGGCVLVCWFWFGFCRFVSSFCVRVCVWFNCLLASWFLFVIGALFCTEPYNCPTVVFNITCLFARFPVF